jgi:hypothetical protein
MDWRHGSNGRVLALQHETLSSNTSPTKKERKETIIIVFSYHQ